MENKEVKANVPKGYLCLEAGQYDAGHVHEGICAHLEELNNARDEDGNPYYFEMTDCTITILVYDASLPITPNIGKPSRSPEARLVLPPIPKKDNTGDGPTHGHRPGTRGLTPGTRIDGVTIKCPDVIPEKWNETKKIVKSIFNGISSGDIKNAKKRQGIAEEGKQPVFISYLQLECEDEDGRKARSTVTKNPVIKFPNDSTINERPKL